VYFARGIDHLVNCLRIMLYERIDSLVPQAIYLHTKVEGHKLADRAQTMQSSTYCQTSKARLCDWCVDNTFGAELVQESLGDLYTKEVFG
jgi:hypothetical protein